MRTKYLLLSFLICFGEAAAFGQAGSRLDSFRFGKDVIITMDLPLIMKQKETMLVIYALPNGNTTAQTMGKLLQPGDDWHYDIQHIRAQTAFVRERLSNRNVVVAYLENSDKSWPQFRKLHSTDSFIIPAIVDSLMGRIQSKKKSLYLVSHSGGGSFVFGYLKAIGRVPGYVKNISFLDSDYGYDSSYLPILQTWLQHKDAKLHVFAYNDSIALLNGKPFVTATGGTWYRSKLLLRDLSASFSFEEVQNDSLIVFKSKRKNICFFFKTNPERKIFHTVQVELNGFIQALLCNTRQDSKDYQYFGRRAYTNLIR